MLNIESRGAVRDGSTVNTEAIQSSLDACAAAGGGTVLVPPGHFITGPLHLRSHVALHLAPGSLLQASRDIASWPLIDDPWSGGQSENTNVPDEDTVFAPLLYGDGLEDVCITGTGTICGAGEVWWHRYRNLNLANRRPRLISPSNVTGLRIENITCRNSPQWTVHPVCCDQVWVRGVRVENPSGSPNTDAIVADSCRDVHISDCHMDTGDDCIILRCGSETGRRPMDRPTENVTITNCTMMHGHGAVVCGSEMSRNVRNVTISNCIFRGTDRGLRFKTRRGRGGIIENIRASNIIMEDVSAPFVMNLFYHCGAKDQAAVSDDTSWPVDATTPRMQQLHFSDITVRNARWAGVFAHGLPEMPIQDISFRNVDIHMADDAEPGMAALAGNIGPMARRGVFMRHVHGACLEGLSVQNAADPVEDIEDCCRITRRRVKSDASFEYSRV